MCSLCGVVWCGVVRCGVVWCGVVRCGVVWCGVVGCGVVWAAGFYVIPLKIARTRLRAGASARARGCVGMWVCI